MCHTQLALAKFRPGVDGRHDTARHSKNSRSAQREPRPLPPVRTPRHHTTVYLSHARSAEPAGSLTWRAARVMASVADPVRSFSAWDSKYLRYSCATNHRSRVFA